MTRVAARAPFWKRSTCWLIEIPARYAPALGRVPSSLEPEDGEVKEVSYFLAVDLFFRGPRC
jgi:hypothetical protein